MGVAESRYERDGEERGEMGAGSREKRTNSDTKTENHTLNQQRQILVVLPRYFQQSKDVDRLFLAIADRGAKDGKLALYQHD